MRVLCLLVILATNVMASGQTPVTSRFIITGKITDCGGNPVGYVSVTIKGKIAGTITGRDGFYRMEGAVGEDSLIFTHVSYQRVAVFINGSMVINASMQKNVLSIPRLSVIDSAGEEVQKMEEIQEGSLHRIFEKVEINASYKGGWKALHRYLAGVIKYPAGVKNRHIEGEVLIGFIVGILGEIKDVRVVRGLMPEYDEVAVNAIRNMPNWVCAIQNGKAVELYVEIPIVFTLKKKGPKMAIFL